MPQYIKKKQKNKKPRTKWLAYLIAFYLDYAFSHLRVCYLTCLQELQTNIFTFTFTFFPSLHFISSHIRACEAQGTEALLSSIEQ